MVIRRIKVKQKLDASTFLVLWVAIIDALRC